MLTAPYCIVYYSYTSKLRKLIQLKDDFYNAHIFFQASEVVSRYNFICLVLGYVCWPELLVQTSVLVASYNFSYYEYYSNILCILTSSNIISKHTIQVHIRLDACTYNHMSNMTCYIDHHILVVYFELNGIWSNLCMGY